MFSGMIAALGELQERQTQAGGARVVVAGLLPGEPLVTGESIAVDGACLTVTAVLPAGFAADLSQETLSRTTLGRLSGRRPVNLERALRVGDRLGGHFVLGHVDATVAVLAVRHEQAFRGIRLALPAALAPEVAEKGSVAVNGVSLTVARLGPDWFEVALVPATLSATNLAELRPGANANLETDVVAKYLRRAIVGATQPIDSLWERFNLEES
ncbi:MAG: riboflavin synthase [Acidobacteriota bacterium]